jgi:hypothetical protein
MIMTVKVYDDTGRCVSVHEALSGKTGPDAVVDALWRAYTVETITLLRERGAAAD